MHRSVQLRRIRPYGEELEVVSDRFPEADDGIAVLVRTKKTLTDSHTADSRDSASKCKRPETPLRPQPGKRLLCIFGAEIK
jgi:hypothetical protein